ncbi:MAG: hypothetical protein HY658_04685 [Actinobacteria bacterium]|nr:hypothetical protein [Actinomycetota bacterium]
MDGAERGVDGAETRRLVDAERGEIVGIATSFAQEAGRVVAEALERAVEQLAVERPDWYAGLGEHGRAAFRGAMASAIARSAAAVAEHLREPDLWLAPTVRVADVPPDPDPRLDALGNRVWLAMSRSATPLDPLLVEFGLEPTDVPDPGGGHFGLQPRSARELDPTSRLSRPWSRYLTSWGRYSGLLRFMAREDPPAEREADPRRGP